ncbi:helix-turn-helix domain-containing protein [Streptomyces qinzhouensis]|uniref:Helix-turn-helix transcriptional regulator n=1 Tax=Streptomyces qinzhouensis TaxID=2599401 RepID=A0A5B8J524_9ACTN|nr:helix-turn-helix transcriptional regulator [Streptomyces qinzhouensis]QDY76875.1 helix-turn-helix transcriptional regulator [Streptomyces qinzhouensis]
MSNRKQLHPERSPREKFGLLVRTLRDERGWTQEELAERVGCTGSHISAVETGRRAATQQFARKLDRVFGTGARLEQQIQAARYTALLEGFPEYVAREAHAAEIRLYEVGVIPGLLQTPQYAAAIEDQEVKRGAITPEQAHERVALVESRQAALVRTPPPLVFVILDESCLLRPVGGRSVMGVQLARLLEFADNPHTALHVAPFSMAERRPYTLPITILTLPDRGLMAYAQSSQHGHFERESAAVVPMLAAYHQLHVGALSQDASVDMIDQIRKGTT